MCDPSFAPAGEGKLAVEAIDAALAHARYLPEIMDALVFRRLAEVNEATFTKGWESKVGGPGVG